MSLQSFTLSNGMLVILEELRACPVISFQAVAKVGSAFETDAEAGIAHLIEHMMFKGTPTRPTGTIARDIEAAGGDMNAYTSFDQTVYYMSMASRFAHKGLEILSDAMQHPLFDAEELEREKEVVLEEIKRERDNPGHVASNLLFKTVFKKHTYGRPIIGFPETVKNFSQDDLFRFYKRWYTPHNMIFVVVGDFDSKKMLVDITKAFSSFSGTPAQKPLSDDIEEPSQSSIRSIANTMNIQGNYFSLGWHIPSIAHEDIPAIDILSHILGGGEASRLELKVKEEQQLALRISSYAYTPRSPGIFAISGLAEEKKMEKLFAAIRDELHFLQTDLVSTDEIARARLNIISSELYERETVGGLAGKHAYLLSTAGNLDFEEKYQQALYKVDAQMLQDVAKKYLHLKQSSVVLVLPETSAWKKKHKSLEGILLKQKKQSIQKKKSGPVVTKLSNGLKLIIQPTHHLPLVSMVAANLGGLRAENVRNNGISLLLSRVAAKGTTQRDSNKIAHDIDRIAGSVGAFSGKNSVGMRAECMSEHLQVGFDLFSEIILDANFDTNEVKKEKYLQLEQIRHQEDNLSKMAFQYFLEALYPKHPYGLPVTGKAASVKKLQAKDLKKAWTDSFHTPEMLISIVGDVNVDTTIHMCEERFSGFKKKASKKLSLKSDAAPKHIIEKKVHKADKQQAHIVLGFKGISFYDKDYYAAQVLNNILSGQGGRLFLQLRDKQSLAYTVTSVLQAGIDPGYFAVYIGTDPAKTDTAISSMKNELELISTKKVKADELDRAKQYIAGVYELDLQRFGSIASNMAFNELYGLGIEEMKKYPERVLKVTTEDVLRVAKKLIHLDAYVLSLVTP
ncbi:MAG: hypothetical protein COX62_05040 [Deltaproteobacteria bacterium CG_4_10_14_0_2_um_filter_43_8]|nr:MAG: hypothetical protein COV43_05540 [Deltaproteobacteria bacterium CG11_big_fil_rev_8_21_14_0_20_42_23]PJA20273.1 MAG: hypothetical protein COX62_05040 [Deltaproteobacteria bacterium CG_4_10_14_0_2_um_filter_43_8]PJC64055.1 MAG: hypothetical protein CO021_06515 [Deltaproteobacteria bacterium CG_4_9_14_0_2_um_filter_42_21]